LYSSNPRRVGIYNTYTWASRWASIHMGSIYSNSIHAEDRSVDTHDRYWSSKSSIKTTTLHLIKKIKVSTFLVFMIKAILTDQILHRDASLGHRVDLNSSK